MISISNMYFNYIISYSIIQLKGEKNMIIGLCGKSGSGKSSISRTITEFKSNAIHYDIDKIAHQVLEIKEVKDEAIKCFGKQIITNGDIDRKKLGELIFTSRERMKELSDLTWEHMQSRLDNIVQNSKDKIIILDWILLSHTPYFDICNKKILVEAPYEIRKVRAMKRDNITSKEFDLREQASIEYDITKFDIVVNNNDINKTRKLVKNI